MSCNPTKRLVDGEYLLVKNELKTQNVDLSKEEMSDILKQRPNRKILPFLRFHLHMYNLPDPSKMAASREKKDKKRDKRNQKRALKKKPKESLGPGRTVAEWFREVVGEPPSILDTSLVTKSREQLSTFLVKKGYFENTVTDSVEYIGKHKARVHYKITAKDPFFIDTIAYKVDDPRLEQYVRSSTSELKLKAGRQFDVERLSDERDRLTNTMRDNGYYFFSKEYVRFQVDSTIGNRMVDVIYRVDNRRESAAGNPDSLVQKPHQKYRLEHIYYTYVLDGKRIVTDSIEFEGYTFLNSSVFPLKKKVIVQNTFLKSNQMYQQQLVEKTYRRLSALSVISHVSIRFEEDKGRNGVLNAFIDIVPARRQNFSLETNGTNTGGALGIEADIVYRHHNIFKGAETLEFRVKGGVQAQQLLTENSTEGSTGSSGLRLNTSEFGPSVSLTIPKFLLPVKSDRFSKSINPATQISAGYFFQSRPDYKRELGNAYVGYSWNETKKKRHQINPLEISVIRIEKSEAFQARLDELNDRFLSDSYQDHFITSSSYTFTFNDRDRQSRKNALYYRGILESSGNLLRSAYKLAGQETDSTGSYSIFNLKFSHYVKSFNDFRFYRTFNEKSTLAIRFSGGVGVPLQNLGVLPFSKSFFSGGANGIRAWRARTLGPGGFFEPAVTYDKIGDVRLESSVEYRFNLIDYAEGAFFVDAGNIWLLKKDDLRPNGEFRANEFISEVALGAGFGLRLNFDFFLIRFDLAGQLKDPSLVKGERWIFQPKENYNAAIEEYNATVGDSGSLLSSYRLRLNFNLGIGYPF